MPSICEGCKTSTLHVNKWFRRKFGILYCITVMAHGDGGIRIDNIVSDTNCLSYFVFLFSRRSQRNPFLLILLGLDELDGLVCLVIKGGGGPYVHFPPAPCTINVLAAQTAKRCIL